MCVWKSEIQIKDVWFFFMPKQTTTHPNVTGVRGETVGRDALPEGIVEDKVRGGVVHKSIKDDTYVCE